MRPALVRVLRLAKLAVYFSLASKAKRRPISVTIFSFVNSVINANLKTFEVLSYVIDTLSNQHLWLPVQIKLLICLLPTSTVLTVLPLLSGSQAIECIMIKAYVTDNEPGWTRFMAALHLRSSWLHWTPQWGATVCRETPAILTVGTSRLHRWFMSWWLFFLIGFCFGKGDRVGFVLGSDWILRAIENLMH